MNQEERYAVLRILTKACEHEGYNASLLEEIDNTIIGYDFFEDLFEILYEFTYDEHQLYTRVTALFAQMEQLHEGMYPRMYPSM